MTSIMSSHPSPKTMSESSAGGYQVIGSDAIYNFKEGVNILHSGHSVFASPDYIPEHLESSQAFFHPRNVAKIQGIIAELFKNHFAEGTGPVYADPEILAEYMDYIYNDRYGTFDCMNKEVAALYFRNAIDELDKERNARQWDFKAVARWDPSLCLRQHPPIRIREQTYNRGTVWMY